ncbi:MAG TPA: diacylglycerol kinase family protein [Bacilli bacterium]|nr:diacylglycerol kinase family protein [Bacilli bacterium]
MNNAKEFINREQNLFIHFFVSFIVIVFSFLFKISIIEWCFVLLSITFVIVSELINSAIERVTDIYMVKYNINAKIAKDTAAGAVLVSAILSVIIGIIVFLPKIILIWEAL